MKNDEWKFDPIPEIMDGKNIADFVDPDILAMLDRLEVSDVEREKTYLHTYGGFLQADEEQRLASAQLDAVNKSDEVKLACLFYLRSV